MPHTYPPIDPEDAAAMTEDVLARAPATATATYVKPQRVQWLQAVYGCTSNGYRRHSSHFSRPRPSVDAATALENLRSFYARHPEVGGWLREGATEFARSLRASVARYGMLTERQMDAARRAMAGARITTGPALQIPVSTARFIAAFNAAAANNVRRPRLRIGDLIVSPAPATSTNAGALYVKCRLTNAYLGKIVNGIFFPVPPCTEAHSRALVAAANDPQAAAVSYGRQTGECAICGRTLTVAESIRRGIGPICASRFGWLG